jgi:UDP-glucose 4-epimerase
MPIRKNSIDGFPGAKPQRYLVTGGAGYVGSHLVAKLLEFDAEVVVLDDLKQGHRTAVPAGVRLVIGNLADPDAMRAAFSHGPYAAIFHFAALSVVSDSILNPFRYFEENCISSLRLIEAACRHGVKRLVFSSTANLFGTPMKMPITEGELIAPGSPYGESKFFVERILAWAERIHGLHSACLRYFNAAGADPAGRLGEHHSPETHLIPLLIDAALGRRPPVTVFGTDYPTPDGTCIRDYVHVSDLAAAHIAVLPLLANGSVAYNVGSGTGYSVLEAMAAVRSVTGVDVPVQLGARRAGDPAMLVADAAALRRDTGWTPKLSDLVDIVATAYRWRAAHPDGYGRTAHAAPLPDMAHGPMNAMRGHPPVTSGLHRTPAS